MINNLSAGKKENLNKKAKFYKIDIKNPKIPQIFKKEKPKIVFHYAAQIDVGKSLENPVFDAKVNILGTLNLLENCRKFKIKKELGWRPQYSLEEGPEETIKLAKWTR